MLLDIAPNSFTAPYTGLLTPVLSYLLYIEGGQVKRHLRWHSWHWRSGFRLRHSCRGPSEPEKLLQDCLTLTSQLLCGRWLGSVVHSLTSGISEWSTPPNVHPSSTISACYQFYQAFPCGSTASDKHWARMPGYEATDGSITVISWECQKCHHKLYHIQ